MDPPAEQAFVRALYRRARLAVRESELARGRSSALRSMRRLLGEQLLVRRCAWCGRFSLGDEWVVGTDLPQFVTKRQLDAATHTICPDCEDRLVREGKSHAQSTE